eukprot:jgi/Mesen1/9520/ME000637S08973
MGARSWSHAGSSSHLRSLCPPPFLNPRCQGSSQGLSWGAAISKGLDCAGESTSSSNSLPGSRPPRRRRTALAARARVTAAGGPGEPVRRARSAAVPPAQRLRELLAEPRLHQAPACHDALAARLVEAAGFNIAVMSGFSVSATRLGLPDMGLLSYGEAVGQVRTLTQSLSIPLIADADTGYGGPLNAKRTVAGYRHAGAAALIIEDQRSEAGSGEGRRTGVWMELGPWETAGSSETSLGARTERQEDGNLKSPWDPMRSPLVRP